MGQTVPSAKAPWLASGPFARCYVTGGKSSVRSESAQIHTLESETLPGVPRWFQVWPCPSPARLLGAGGGSRSPLHAVPAVPVRSPISEPCRWSSRTEGPATTFCDPRRGSWLPASGAWAAVTPLQALSWVLGVWGGPWPPSSASRNWVPPVLAVGSLLLGVPGGRTTMPAPRVVRGDPVIPCAHRLRTWDGLSCPGCTWVPSVPCAEHRE